MHVKMIKTALVNTTTYQEGYFAELTEEQGRALVADGRAVESPFPYATEGSEYWEKVNRKLIRRAVKNHEKGLKATGRKQKDV